MGAIGDVPADLLKNLGASGIVLLVVVMILTDRLVTRRRLDDMTTDRDKLKKTVDVQAETIRTEIAQMRMVVVELAETVDKFTRELQMLARDRQRGHR